MAPVGIWRELRRAPLASNMEGIIGKLVQAADEGDWGSYVSLMGGPKCTRADYSIELDKKEITTPSRYNEPLGKRVIGVKCGNVHLVTRIHTWTVKSCQDNKNCTNPKHKSSDVLANAALPIRGKTDKAAEFSDHPPDREEFSDDFRITRLAPLEFCQ